jgi:pimeloyl-ACP methyl ester carboxylesterase
METVASPSIVDQPPSFVRLEGCEMAYRRVGRGEPLLLVHGYPLSGLTFRGQVPTLAEHFTCYLPDLPGAGETRWSDATDFSFEGQARALRGFADALGLRAYAVLAHDTGATIARRLAILDAARVTRLVLIGTEIPGHRPPWIPFFQRVASPKRTFLSRYLLSQRWFRRSSAGFGGCFADPSWIDGEFFRLFLAPLIASKPRASGQTRYLLGIDWRMVDGFETEHAKITAPTLLIWGEDDPVFPVARARPMADQLANCHGFVTVPGAKLFVHEEKPETVARIALDFLG